MGCEYTENEITSKFTVERPQNGDTMHKILKRNRRIKTAKILEPSSLAGTELIFPSHIFFWIDRYSTPKYTQSKFLICQWRKLKVNYLVQQTTYNVTKTNTNHDVLAYHQRPK